MKKEWDKESPYRFKVEPTPEHSEQKHLIIVLAGVGLGLGGSGQRADLQQKEALAGWLWNASDAWEWLEPRRQLFPGASAQELVEMAVVPEDIKHQTRALISGCAENRVGRAELWAFGAPQWSVLSEGCALCVFSAVMLSGGKTKALKSKLKEGFQARMREVIPSVKAIDEQWIGELFQVPLDQLEAQVFAHVEAQELSKQKELKQAQGKPKKPGGL